ncbi:RimJ/RimL family protein N-acetyltransferase [Balneicella halophila]|uniref:RimJ/RimL family protein N-acetyltransferase n=1 Tax=Balneicella halophila TaxID=1537566 RepID=A0A7L4UQH7_BALHA|nr:GNAT family protein [Balneicella halophila]PVX52026.1 RimJ/RimL family protein N-acetyltransferase [Balneicella halophila]
MLDFQKIIQSDKVILRPMKIDDFGKMKSLTADSEMWYYFTDDLSDKTILKQWIQTAITELENRTALPFTIVDIRNGEIIGTTRIGNISEKNSRVEIGWTWISKPYQGTGINGHVKRLLFDYLFTGTNTLRIEFKTDVLNIPARKAMERVGLVEEGVLRSHTLMTNNRRRDTIYYSILKDDWQKK